GHVSDPLAVLLAARSGGVDRERNRPGGAHQRQRQSHTETARHRVAAGQIEGVLLVDDVVPVLLPLHLLGRAAVVVVRAQPTRGRAEKPFTSAQVRVGGRAEHGRVLTDEDSTLRPGGPPPRKKREDESKNGHGNALHVDRVLRVFGSASFLKVATRAPGAVAGGNTVRRADSGLGLRRLRAALPWTWRGRAGGVLIESMGFGAAHHKSYANPRHCLCRRGAPGGSERVSSGWQRDEVPARGPAARRAPGSRRRRVSARTPGRPRRAARPLCPPRSSRSRSGRAPPGPSPSCV